MNMNNKNFFWGIFFVFPLFSTHAMNYLPLRTQATAAGLLAGMDVFARAGIKKSASMTPPMLQHPLSAACAGAVLGHRLGGNNGGSKWSLAALVAAGAAYLTHLYPDNPSIPLMVHGLVLVSDMPRVVEVLKNNRWKTFFAGIAMAAYSACAYKGLVSDRFSPSAAGTMLMGGKGQALIMALRLGLMQSLCKKTFELCYY